MNPNNKFTVDTRMMDIPAEATVFNMQGACSFGEGEEDKKNIRLMLYDGSIVKHWYWGNMGFELASMKLAKKTVPILDTHDVDRRVGFSTAATFDGKFQMDGRLLDNEWGRAIQADSAGGYPFEASLRFDPNKSRIEYIKEGASVAVNGHTLSGPGTLITNTVVVEGSVCTFGAQNNCVTEVFSYENKEQQDMGDNNVVEMTGESLAKDYPAVHKEIADGAFAKGAEAEKKKFAAFAAQFGDDPVFLVEQYSKGATIEEATSAQNKLLKEKLLAAQQKGNEQGDPGKKGKVDPAEQEFSDAQDKVNNGKRTAGEPAGQSKTEKMREEFTASEDYAPLMERCGDKERALRVYCNMKTAQAEGRIKL